MLASRYRVNLHAYGECVVCDEFTKGRAMTNENEGAATPGVLRLSLLSGSRTESPAGRSATTLEKIFGTFSSITMSVDVTPNRSVSITIVRATLDGSGHREEHEEGTVEGGAGSAHALRNGAGMLRIVEVTKTHAVIELSPK